jgi:hypothetical protein
MDPEAAEAALGWKARHDFEAGWSTPSAGT